MSEKYSKIRYGFDKVYKQGFNIKTPINLNLQSIATTTLRNGLIEFDHRKGWRGPIKNIKYKKDWYKNFKRLSARKLFWMEVAIVKKT